MNDRVRFSVYFGFSRLKESLAFNEVSIGDAKGDLICFH